jgi:cytidyltransferase-like protein
VIIAPASADPDELPQVELPTEGAYWAVLETEASPRKEAFCQSVGINYQVINLADLRGFPLAAIDTPENYLPRPKVVVTGCYDWFHSGHVRFFEEVAELGELYVIVGNDVNVRFLKGEGHPLFPQDERRYVVQSVRSVHQCLITSGMGWMDAEPEIAMVKPEMYAVNEDGDKPEKRAFCQEHGIRYVVLTRKPKPGLPRRQSTDLRGY